MQKVKVVHGVSAIKIYDTLERSSANIYRKVFVAYSRAKDCNLNGFVNVLF